jgi:hypothetical protein
MMLQSSLRNLAGSVRQSRTKRARRYPTFTASSAVAGVASGLRILRGLGYAADVVGAATTVHRRQYQSRQKFLNGRQAPSGAETSECLAEHSL